MATDADQQAKFEDLSAEGCSQCEGCQYYQEWSESRGEFWGAPCSETMSECTATDWTECPAMEDEDE